LIWQAAAVAAPLFVRKAIDEGIVGADRQALYLWAGVIVALGAVEVASWGVRHYLAIRNGTIVEADAREGVFGHALALDPRYHDSVDPGDLMSRAAIDAGFVRRAVDAMGHMSGFLLTIVAASALMLTIDLRLALIVLVPLPFLSVAMWLYSDRYRTPSRELQEAWASASTVVEESVAGVRVVKGLGAGAPLSARFRRSSDRIVDRALAVAGVDAFFFPLLELLPMLALVAVLWFGGNRVLEGTLTVGELVALYAYVALLVWPMRTLGRRIETLQRALAGAERITEVLDAESSLREAAAGSPATPSRGHVRFEGVRFGYGAGAPVLDGFDLELAPGESVALVGPTGSGKTTVAALLARFYDVEAGAVLLDGVDVRELPPAAVRGAVALVFEETFSSPTRCGRTSPSRAPKRPTPTSSARHAWPGRTTSCSSFRTATTPCSASGATRSPAARGSGSRSPGRCSPTRSCSSSTTPPRPWTRRRRRRSARRSPSRWRAERPS
jgi:ATP-binding cassette subfamily B protein